MALTGDASAQGCVAARCPVNISPGQFNLHRYETGVTSTMQEQAGHTEATGKGAPAPVMQPEQASRWQATIGYRWLKSDRHFTGSHEDRERQIEHSEVINDSSYIDLGLTYFHSPRLSFTLIVPYSYHDRSNRIAFQGQTVGRSHVQASGIGDLRLSANYWLIDPATNPRGNVLLGIGVDAPTGKEDTDDYRQIRDPATGLIVVDASAERINDQSIQPGDGGWGIPIDLYAYYRLNDRLSAYGSLSYLITPEEKNGVLTGRGNINDPTNNFESIMGIADTFAGRVGFEYAALPQKGLSVSLGVRRRACRCMT